MLRVANRASLWVLAGIAALAGARLLAALEFPGDSGAAVESLPQLLRTCLVRELLHLPCPGCGMTRALASLARGDWLAALRYHPFSPLLALEAIGLWLAWGVHLWRGRAGVSLARPAVHAGHAVQWLPWVAVNGAALIALWAGRLASGDLAAVLRP